MSRRPFFRTNRTAAGYAPCGFLFGKIFSYGEQDSKLQVRLCFGLADEKRPQGMIVFTATNRPYVGRELQLNMQHFILVTSRTIRFGANIAGLHEG